MRLTDVLVEGVNLLTIPLRLEFRALHQVLEDLDSDVLLLHSKDIGSLKKDGLSRLDLTGHAELKTQALRRSISLSDIPDPSDIAKLLSTLRTVNKAAQKNYIVWWSPSDLLLHSMSDLEIAKSLRLINSSFSIKFLAIVMRDVHSHLEFLALASNSWIDMHEHDHKIIFEVIKHYDHSMEGKTFGNETM